MGEYLVTYLIKSHFCEWPGEMGNVSGTLHGGPIHCRKRGHHFAAAQTSLAGNKGQQLSPRDWQQVPVTPRQETPPVSPMASSMRCTKLARSSSSI